MLKQIKNLIFGIRTIPATNQFQCPTIEYLFLNGRMELKLIKFPIKIKYWRDNEELSSFEEINPFLDIGRYSMSVCPITQPFTKKGVMLKIPYFFTTIPFLKQFRKEIKKFIDLYENNYLKRPTIKTNVRLIDENSLPDFWSKDTQN